jgi:hypothetical protein
LDQIRHSGAPRLDRRDRFGRGQAGALRPTFEPGFDFRGNDYSRINLPAANPRLCQERCQAEGRCRAWAYNGPGLHALLTGIEQYRKAQASIEPITVRHAECASSCSFIHSGGVDRLGPVNVHRPSPAHDLAEFEERQAAGARVRKFYEHMDAGEDLIQIWATTSARSLRPALATRFPRYLNDYLRAQCSHDGEDLQRQETALLRTADKSRLAGVREQRAGAEQCIAGEFERARLAIFDRLCGARCDASKIRAEIDRDIIAAVGR